MEMSIIVPIYNEEATIGEFRRRLLRVLESMTLPGGFELIFTNDGSRDQRVRCVDFSRNFGHQIAVTAGLDRAEGEAVVIIDADLQDPPELIPLLY